MRIYFGLIVVFAVFIGSTKAQVPAPQKQEDDQTVLSKGDIAEYSMVEMQSARSMDPTYAPAEPNVKEKVTEPGLVCFKGDKDTSSMHCELDWTAGQHAHSLMEHLRIGIYELQSGKNVALEQLAIHDAANLWPQLRNIYCRAYPTGMYYDLQGQTQFCEGKGTVAKH
jgi:hypothetical protein